MRLAWLAVLALPFAGCTCSRSSSPASGDAGAATVVASGSGTTVVPGAAVFSLPIGAAHASGGDAYFAGLVAARNVYELVKIKADGSTAWSVDALTNVHWSSDADVHVFGSPSGGALVLGRGTRDGKLVREIVGVDANGKIRGPAEATKNDACAIAGGVASLRETGDKAFVTLRDFTGAPPRDLFALRADGDHELVCGDTTMFAVSHGDSIVLERDGAKSVVVQSGDPGSDDGEDDLETVAAGDDFVAVSVKRHAVSVREITAARVAAWRSVGHLPDGADVEVIDGDAKDLYVVFALEAKDVPACSGGGFPSRIHALHVPRGGGGAAHVHALGLLACDSDDGPFFTGFSRAGGARKFFVAWPERRPPKSGEPPISALAYVAIANDTVADVVRIPVDADGITDAGCDDDACYAAVLLRSAGTDGMVPGPAKVLRYPSP